MKNFAGISLLLVMSALAICGQTATSSPVPCAEEKARADKAESRLKDWGNTARYKDADAKLAPPARDERRVVFMGDSITDFWKLDEYFPNLPYINRGISGQTTPQMLIRFRPDVIALKPQAVVILAGTNDIGGITGPMTVEEIENNLESMVELAQASGIRVVLASLLPVGDYNKTKDGKPVIRSVQRPPSQILALNRWIKQYAAQMNLVYLDYYSALADDKGFFKEDLARDGLHPNAKGYELMKPLAEKAVAAALKEKKKLIRQPVSD